MANVVKGLLTTYASTAQVEGGYFFVVSGSGYSPKHDTSSYMFIGSVDAWLNDNDPPPPTQNQVVVKGVLKNMIAAKLITSSNMCPVVQRIDWTTGTVYDYYKDYEDMFTRDEYKKLTKLFYVRNRFDQIFKCLYNNNGGQSTVEPILQPGTTQPGQTLILSDGYKWIYVTTIDKGLKKNFFDDSWMPLTVGQARADSTKPAGLGEVNAINVSTRGNNYTNGTDTTIVTITGDGRGAKAYANVYNRQIQDIIVTEPGNNYTYATVTVTVPAGYPGANAVAIPIVSPVGGHGSDPISELGCDRLMISVELNGAEGGKIPTNISFRQVGIVVNPQLKTGAIPTGTIYNTTDLCYVTFGTGSYQSGEQVYQGANLNSASFIGKVCSWDSSNNILHLINTQGTHTLGEAIIGATSGTTRVSVQYDESEIAIGSGYLMYVENRSPVQRSPNGNEQLRLVLSF